MDAPDIGADGHIQKKYHHSGPKLDIANGFTVSRIRVFLSLHK